MQSDEQTLNYGNWQIDILILVLLIPIIFILSLEIGWRNSEPKLLEPDSVYMLRLAEKFSKPSSEVNKSNIPWYRDNLSYHPTGRDLRFEKMLLPCIGGKLYELATLLGLPYSIQTLEIFLFYVTLGLNILTALSIYVLMITITGRIPAFLTSLFYTVSTANLIKTWPGCFDKEPLAGVFIILMFSAFLYSSKTPFGSIKNLLGAVICAELFSALKLTWGGYQFYLAVWCLTLMLYFSLFLMRKSKLEDPRSAALSFLLSYGLGTILAWLVSPIACAWIEPQILIRSLVILCGMFSIWIFIQFRFKFGSAFLTTLGFILIATLGTLYYFFGVHPIASENVTAQNVDEFAHGNWFIAAQNLGIMAYTAPLCGLYVFFEGLRRRKLPYLFLGIWFIIGILGFWWRKRLFYALALPVPASILIFIYIIGIRAWSKTRFSFRKSFILRFGYFGLSMMILSVLMAQSFLNARNVVPRIQHALEWTKYWRDASLWIKDNTPNDSLIVSWWDNGYLIQTFGQRTTLVDGGNPETSRNVDVANMLMSKEDIFGELLEKYKPGKRPVYLIVSMKDLASFEGINAHAGQKITLRQILLDLTGSPERDESLINDTLQKNNIHTYLQMRNSKQMFILYLSDLDETITLHPEWKEFLLFRLLPFELNEEKSVKYFHEVYNNGYVYVYQFHK